MLHREAFAYNCLRLPGRYWLTREMGPVRHPAKRRRIKTLEKPEPLKENLNGFWSRCIDDTHRLIYCIDGKHLVVIACRYQYQ